MGPQRSRGVAAFAALLAVLALRATEAGEEAVCTEDVLRRWSGAGYPTQLDYGIYWVGHGDEIEKAGPGSTLYDPSKRTVLFFHGYSGGQTERCARTTSRCPGNTCPNEDLLFERWLFDGWNVGIFYWDQLADEPCERDAEQKIWFDDVAAGTVRWRSFDPATKKSAFHHLEGDKSVAALCADHVREVMADYSGGRTRFVGHGIGAQLAVRCGFRLHTLGHAAAPQRLALLEPYFTSLHLGLRCGFRIPHRVVKNYVPKATVNMVRTLWDEERVVTEVVKTSALTQRGVFGDPDHALESIAAFVEYYPTHCDGNVPVVGPLLHMHCKHRAVVPTYFLQYGHTVPPLTSGQEYAVGDVFKRCPTPCAACSDEDVRELVDQQRILLGAQSWDQDEGGGTLDPEDDTFALRPHRAIDPAAEQKAVLRSAGVAHHREDVVAAAWSAALQRGVLCVAALLLLVACLCGFCSSGDRARDPTFGKAAASESEDQTQAFME